MDDPREVDHTCENKACVNPRHLQALTKREHMAKGFSSGEIGNYKLTECQVREILAKYQTGKFTQKELGKAYGVDASAIGRITTGKNWPEVYRDFHGLK